MRAGPGASWKPTAMSAGFRPTRSGPSEPTPTHKVTVPRAFAFAGPDIKLPPAVALPMGARVAVTRQDERFAVTALGWHIPEVYLAPVKVRQPDFVAVAERFVGTPLFVGRQDLSRAWTARAWSRFHCRQPASRVPATATCRSLRSENCLRLQACAGAIWCSGKATSPLQLIPRRLFTQMPII